MLINRYHRNCVFIGFELCRVLNVKKYIYTNGVGIIIKKVGAGRAIRIRNLEVRFTCEIGRCKACMTKSLPAESWAAASGNTCGSPDHSHHKIVIDPKHRKKILIHNDFYYQSVQRCATILRIKVCPKQYNTTVRWRFIEQFTIYL